MFLKRPFIRLQPGSHVGLSQVGDTIVEVLIALSIVGLILVTAYIATSHNTSDIQDAQERSQALQLVQSQIEFLRTHHPFTGPATCFDASGNPKIGTTTLGSDPCTVTASGQMAAAQAAPAYKLSITGTDSTEYQVTAKWSGLVSNQPDVVTVYYEVQ